MPYQVFQCLQSNKVKQAFIPISCRQHPKARTCATCATIVPFLVKSSVNTDVIVGWNRILSLERSHFPSPFQWQITEPCSQLLQAIPAQGHLLSHNLLWKWLKSLSERFTVGCTVFPVPSLRCKWKKKKKVCSSKEVENLEYQRFSFQRLPNMQIKAASR